MNNEQFKEFQNEIHQVMKKYQVFEGLLLVNDEKAKMIWMAAVIDGSDKKLFKYAMDIIKSMKDDPQFVLHEKIEINPGNK